MGMDKKEFLDKSQDELYLWKEGELLILPDLFLDKIWDEAHQHGRESLLRAAQELVGSRSVLDDNDDTEAARGKQVDRTLDILEHWTNLSPNSNCYSVGGVDRNSVNKKYSACLHRYGGNMTVFYGAKQQEALANAAQSVVVEVEAARAKK